MLRREETDVRTELLYFRRLTLLVRITFIVCIWQVSYCQAAAAVHFSRRNAIYAKNGALDREVRYPLTNKLIPRLFVHYQAGGNYRNVIYNV